MLAELLAMIAQPVQHTLSEVVVDLSWINGLLEGGWCFESEVPIFIEKVTKMIKDELEQARHGYPQG